MLLSGLRDEYGDAISGQPYVPPPPPIAEPKAPLLFRPPNIIPIVPQDNYNPPPNIITAQPKSGCGSCKCGGKCKGKGTEVTGVLANGTASAPLRPIAAAPTTTPTTKGSGFPWPLVIGFLLGM